MPFVSTNRPCARCCDVYKCSYCPERQFQTAYSLIQHLKQNPKHKWQPNSTAFQCEKCNATFQTKLGYIHHLQQKRIHKDDLHQAACCGRFQDVATFIQNENANETGASHKLSSGDLGYQYGKTPMHCAAFKGYSRCLRIMLSWEDGDPNVADEFGQTPVHVAARCGKARCLGLLLSKGGRLDSKDSNGKTPLKLATEQCMTTILQYQIAAMIGKEISKYYLKKLERVRSSKAIRELNFSEDSEAVEDESSSEDEKANDSDPGSSGVTFLSAAPSCMVENKRGDKELQDVQCSSAMIRESKTNKVTKKRESDKISKAICSTSTKQSYILAEGKGDVKREYADEDVCSSSAMIESNSDVIVKKQVLGKISEVSLKLLPCEVIARGEKAITAFKTALDQGISSASRLKIIVVGNVGAGKTSLTRSLSGQPFDETRVKTHGIQTTPIVEPIVENTELNISWKLAKCSESHLDALIAKVVSDTLKEISETPSRQVPELSPSPRDFNVSQIMEPTAGTSEDLATSPQPIPSSQVLITEPSIVVEGSPRKLPATLIAKNLLSKKSENVSVKVNIWDFAGHKLYEPMHHVFMNSRSLYLVVFNLHKMSESPEKSLCSIHYWLNSIASHTTWLTPVILVGTHKAKVSADFIEEARSLCEKNFASTFGHRLVRGFNAEIFLAVENSGSEEDEGIANLKSVIKNDAAANFDFMNDKFPLKWLHCEEEIINYQQDPDAKKFATLKEVKSMLEQKCMIKFTEDEFNSMMSYFHDSGLVLLPATMCGVDEGSLVHDLVILSPQYLVDIMTTIHDVPKDRSLQRQFSDEFRKLESEGRIDRHVLQHVWKNMEVNADVLVELLSCFNLLYPLKTEEDEKNGRKGSKEYIIPCMLKDRSDERCEKRWKKACESWKDETDKEHELVFDFGRFLPLPLFDYLLVHIYRHSCKTNGITPILERRTAIFSFSNKFLFRLKLVLKDCQIWVYSRCRKSEDFLELAQILKTKVYEICQQFFKYLKFVFGPPCPREYCPGATFHAENIQRPCESSSSEDDEKSEAESTNEEVKKNERRCHVIPMNPTSFDPPYWCQEVDLSEQLQDWNPTIAPLDEDENQDCEQEEFTDAPNFQKVCVEECCITFVSDRLGNSWKDLGR